MTKREREERFRELSAMKVTHIAEVLIQAEEAIEKRDRKLARAKARPSFSALAQSLHDLVGEIERGELELDDVHEALEAISLSFTDLLGVV